MLRTKYRRIARDHFIEGGLVAILESIDEQTIEGNFLGFGGHAFCLALMGIFLNCSQDFVEETTYMRQLAVNRRRVCRAKILAILWLRNPFISLRRIGLVAQW